MDINETNNLRKDLGAFYTPKPLVKELTEKTLSLALISQMNEKFDQKFDNINEIISNSDLDLIITLLRNIDELTVLDGSVGDGRFLISAFEYLSAIQKEIIKKRGNKLEKNLISVSSHYLKNLYGMEIDSNSLLICKDNLKSLITHKGKRNEICNIIEDNIVIGNFLRSDVSEWIRLRENFVGFDIIIGNPPWGIKLSKNEKDYFFEEFGLKGSKRNLNAFELFVYKSYTLLSPDKGILALYLPKNFTRSNQYMNLRKYLLEKLEINYLNFFERFHNVTQEFISLVGRKTSKINPQHEILINNKRKIPQVVFQSNTDNIFSLEIDESTRLKLLSIKADSLPLEKFLTIKRGEELSKKGGIMFCKQCQAWVPLSSRKPEIECPNCLAKIKKKDLQRQYLINKTQTPEHQKSILTGEDFDRFFIKGNHFFNDSVNFRTKKNSEIYRSPKIVVQKIKQYPWAAYDQQHRLTTQNVYNLRLKEDLSKQTEILFYILAILNSQLMSWYYEKQFNLGSKFTNAISIRNLKRLPIKNPKTNENLFLNIVKQVKKLLATENNKDVRSQIDKLDNLIALLYEADKESNTL